MLRLIPILPVNFQHLKLIKIWSGDDVQKSPSSSASVEISNWEEQRDPH